MELKVVDILPTYWILLLWTQLLLLLGLYWILAPAVSCYSWGCTGFWLRPKTSHLYKSGSGQNVARFRFLAGVAKWRIQVPQCSVFQLVSKNCTVDVAIFSIRLLCWDFATRDCCEHLCKFCVNFNFFSLRGILHADYQYPSSLSSFVNKSHIWPAVPVGFVSSNLALARLQNLNPVQL